MRPTGQAKYVLNRMRVEKINATTNTLIPHGTAYMIVPKPRIVLSAKIVVTIPIAAKPKIPSVFSFSVARLRKTHHNTIKPAKAVGP
jgi:hypothetical protein